MFPYARNSVHRGREAKPCSSGLSASSHTRTHTYPHIILYLPPAEAFWSSVTRRLRGRWLSMVWFLQCACMIACTCAAQRSSEQRVGQRSSEQRVAWRWLGTLCPIRCPTLCRPEPVRRACSALSPAGWVSLKCLANKRNGIRFSLIRFFFLSFF